MRKSIFFLILIFCFTVFSRFFQVTKLPSGLSSDEVSFAYNAFTISFEGKDQFGLSYPLYFETFGEYKNPVPVYFLVPFYQIVGVNKFAIRIASAFVSILSVLFLYLFTAELIRNKKIALISALFLATSPWHYFFSRFWGGYIPGLLFLLMGLYFTLKIRKSSWWGPLAIVFLMLSYYSYHSTKLVIFLLTPIILFWVWKGEKKKLVIFTYVLFGVGLLLSFFFLQQTLARAKMVSIFANPELSLKIVNQIHAFNPSEVPLLFVRIIVNKPVVYAKAFLDQFLYHFSPSFLLFDGDKDRLFHFPNEGIMYMWQAPLLLFGVIFVLKEKVKQFFFLLYFWIISLLPSALSASLLSISSRSFLAIIPILILCSVAVLVFIARFRTPAKIYVIIGISLLMIWSNMLMNVNYFYNFKQSSVNAWRSGDEVVSNYIFQNRTMNIYVDENAILAEHYLFYNHMTEKEAGKHSVVRVTDPYGFIHIARLDNIFFVQSQNMQSVVFKPGDIYIGYKGVDLTMPCKKETVLFNTSDPGTTILTIKSQMRKDGTCEENI